MIRLDDGWWLEASATGWWLVSIAPPKKGAERQPRPVQRHGPFTSPTHVLQQRAVKVPKRAREAIAELEQVVEAGEVALQDVPPAAE
jgi:hypothetical protein